MKQTIESQINQVFNKHTENKYKQKNTSFEYRKKKLLRIRDLISENEAQIELALEKDFGKHSVESSLTEILPVILMINYHIKNLKKWMSPRKVKSSLLFTGASSYISYEAKGNCLVLSPWNYPFNLSVYPILTAFSAGNTVIVKPSEFTPHTNSIIESLFNKVFDQNEISFINGEVNEANLLLEKPFNHIFFTGSTSVGKIIMNKASEHLASVSLELGGKSPVILDENYSIDEFAKKIVWGKFVNSGQTCVAPDYILVDPLIKKDLVTFLIKYIEESYTSNPIASKDLCNIITTKHAQRLHSLLTNSVELGAVIEYGGVIDEKNCRFAPTILSNVDVKSDIMNEEIFGPILPIIEIEGLDKKIEFINSKDNSLALYIFSNDKKFIKKVQDNTTSGGLSINETLLHVGHSELPFGGAGKSGIGRYHSHYGFEELSNIRSVFHRKTDFGLSYFYPPYSKQKKKLLHYVMNYFSRFL